MSDNSDSLKTKTARSIKWNVIDRVSSQVLYAITGIVLARLLSVEDFGLVSVVLIFQAFASLLVDSGFSYALIQRKNPSQTDYSTVLWFNVAVAVGIYAVLYFLAPLIADFFQGDRRLIPLSRVLFLSFIINASAIVQTNRLMKAMDVKMVAVSNSLGLCLAGVTGIALALAGYGAWAIVWQTVVLASVKSLGLWTTQRWFPDFTFSWSSLRSFFNIGSRMMFTSFLNTLFQNIYSFVIGNRSGMAPLGYYGQSDKWSKMGIMSLYQVITSSFLPALSAVQDDDERFKRVCSKMSRLTSYLVFPSMLGLMAMATPIFHTLFGSKWDPSIILFQLLIFRGIFTIFTGLYNNFLLAKSHARTIMWMEILRDSVAILALVATLPFINETKPGNPVWGLEILLWGQIISSVITFIVTMIYTAKLIGTNILRLIYDIAPYLCLTLLILPIMTAAGWLSDVPVITLIIEIVVASGLYFAANRISGSKIQTEVIGYLSRKKV